MNVVLCGGPPQSAHSFETLGNHKHKLAANLPLKFALVCPINMFIHSTGSLFRSLQCGVVAAHPAEIVATKRQKAAVGRVACEHRTSSEYSNKRTFPFDFPIEAVFAVRVHLSMVLLWPNIT